MDFSKLSYSQVETLATQLNGASTSMESLFNKVGTDDVWSGTAASETKNEFDTLSAKFPEFSNAINDCYRYLMSVVETYKNVDATVQGK